MNRESIHQFGENAILTGILTEPAVIKADDLCFVILNAGLVHHVGPFRIHVDLGRDVANLGMPSFRFDLSGIGDSQRREGEQTDAARAVIDIRDAFDYLSDRKGFSKFVTFGLCSGADNAHATALQDHRLVGAVMLDGPGYPNFLYRVHHYGPRILKIKPWANKFKQLVKADARMFVRQEINTRSFGPQN
ncbi:MAG TPA: alpha/beta fold hydrolase, partial [Nitrospirota bacterium]|nr:alpha/beta fold hydrolase [Nitrospirota bacterium]